MERASAGLWDFRKEQRTIENVLDPGQATFAAYGGGGIPKVVLIGKDGIVRFYQEGSNSRHDFEAEVKKLGL